LWKGRLILDKSPIKNLLAKVEVVTLLHVLAGISLGISLALAPSTLEAGVATTLLIIAILALFEAMIARRNRKASIQCLSINDSSINDSPIDDPFPSTTIYQSESVFVGYVLFVLCLVFFFLLVTNLAIGGLKLWVYCALFAFFTYLWRDFPELSDQFSLSFHNWKNIHLVSMTVGLAPFFYYLVYGLLSVSSKSFAVYFAALFHLVSIVFRNLLNGPLNEWFVEPDEKEIEKILSGYYGKNHDVPLPARELTIASIIQAIVAEPDSSKEQDDKAEEQAQNFVEKSAEASKQLYESVEETDESKKYDEPKEQLSDLEEQSAESDIKLNDSKEQPAASTTSPSLSDYEFMQLNDGLGAWEKGDEVGALKCFLQLIRSKPGLEDPTMWAVQLAARQNMTEQARLLLMDFLKTNPSSYGGFFQLAKLLAEEGKISLAVRAYIRCSQLSPEAVSPLKELALLSMEADSTEKALVYGQQVLKIDSTNQWAVKFVDQIEGSVKERKIDSLRQKAKSLLAAREKGKALLVFKKLAALEPKDLQSRLVGARILLETGSTDDAVNIFEEALSVPFEGHNGFSLPVDLVKAYCEAEQYEKALAEIHSLRLHFPLHVDLGFLAIDTFLELKRFSEVKELSEDSSSPEASLIAAYALIRGELFNVFTADEVDDMAWKHLDKVDPGKSPSVPYVESNKILAGKKEITGILLARAGKTDEAIVALEKAVSIEPRSASIRKELASARMLTSQKSRAIVHYETLSSLEPSNFCWRYKLLDALKQEADSRGQAGDYFDAILADKKRMLHEDISNVAVMYETAMASVIFGRDVSSLSGGGACHYLKVVLKSMPHNFWAINGLKEFYLSSIGPEDGKKQAFELLKRKAKHEKADSYTLSAFASFMMMHKGFGSNEEVEEFFKKALDKNSINEEALFGLAKYLFVSGKQDEADRYSKRALRVAPFNIESKGIRQLG